MHLRKLIKENLNTRMNLDKKYVDVLINRRIELVDIELEENTKEIKKHIKQHKDEMEIDCLIEAFTHIGLAPSILYDDNGHFAICGDGFQTISIDDEPIDTDLSFYILKEDWKPTIREAINHYIETLELL